MCCWDLQRAPGLVGVTFKENVEHDIRIQDRGHGKGNYWHSNIRSTWKTRLCHQEEVFEEYGLQTDKNRQRLYDGWIRLADKADAWVGSASLRPLPGKGALVADLKGIYKNKITSRKYWSL